MSTSRRSVLQLLGLSTVAGPLAAKSAADSEVARLSGICVGSPAFGEARTYSQIPNDASFDNARIVAGQYAKNVGVPAFVKEALRRNNSYVGSLDPDIAAKRSWSMSVKILTQRERQFARALEGIEYNAWQAQGASMFKKITGWDWPW